MIPPVSCLGMTQFGYPRGTVGRYTLDRQERKVAREYRRLVQESSHLPLSSTKFPILTV